MLTQLFMEADLEMDTGSPLDAIFVYRVFSSMIGQHCIYMFIAIFYLPFLFSIIFIEVL